MEKPVPDLDRFYQPPKQIAKPFMPADVVSGATFRLHDPAAVLARWSRQIELLPDLKQENG
jgi:hypothetical protein